jgi:hypothetical protein
MTRPLVAPGDPVEVAREKLEAVHGHSGRRRHPGGLDRVRRCALRLGRHARNPRLGARARALSRRGLHRRRGRRLSLLRRDAGETLRCAGPAGRLPARTGASLSRRARRLRGRVPRAAGPGRAARTRGNRRRLLRRRARRRRAAPGAGRGRTPTGCGGVPRRLVRSRGEGRLGSRSAGASRVSHRSTPI